MRSTVESDEALARYDNRQALGAAAVTFTPNNTVPTAAQLAVGVTARDGARSGTNHRAIYIENDGAVFDNIGAFLSGSYNNAAVRAPDGTPGVTGSVLRLNDPGFYPRDIHVGESRETRLSASYNLETKSKWFGRHRLAAMVSQSTQFD
jgi:hypothetical protein